MNSELLELTVLNSLKIYQPKKGYKFSYEPFVLMKDISIKDESVFIDFGSGCGIVSVLANRHNSQCTIYAVENNNEMIEIIKENMYLNNIKNVEIIDNIQKVGTNAADIVVSNPPYFKEGLYRKSQKFFNEKFEGSTIDEMLSQMRRIIKNKGILKITYHTSRFTEIVSKLNKFGFGIKCITPVYGNKDNDAQFLIIESKFNSKNYIVFRKAIYLEDLKLSL